MQTLGPFEPQPHLAVAVSGGPDSRALALLAAHWAQARQGRITALVIDHGLRPESADEMRQTLAWLHALLLPAEGLRVEVAPGNRQAQARTARYGALTGWCREQGVLHLLLGHHRDDQQETFWQRLARGSGVEGLSGMSALAYRREVRLLRPLLGLSKAELVDFLTQAGHAWITDLSNASEAYQRNRLRRIMPLLEAEGLIPERLEATTQRLGRTAAYVRQQTARFLAMHGGLSEAGYGWMETTAWRAAAPEIAERALRAMLASVRGRDAMPRFEEVARLAEAMRLADFRGTTLHGCRVIPHAASGRCYVLRELEAAPLALCPATQRWDARYEAQGPEGYLLRALGAEGLKQLCTEGFCVPKEFPAALLHRLPSVWQLERCVAVPHIGYGASFADTGVSVRFAPRKALC